MVDGCAHDVASLIAGGRLRGMTFVGNKRGTGNEYDQQEKQQAMRGMHGWALADKRASQYFTHPRRPPRVESTALNVVGPPRPEPQD